MEPLYWQASIIASILGLYFILSPRNRKFAFFISLIASLGWTIETFVLLCCKLLYFQLGTIWISFLIVFYLNHREEKEELTLEGMNEESKKKDHIILEKIEQVSRRDQTISERDRIIGEKDQTIGERDQTVSELGQILIESLKKPISEFPQSEQNLIQESLKNNPSFTKIEGSQHINFLNDCLSEANHSIIILSGWIREKVVDRNFLNLLRTKLNKGVDVYLGYGFESYTFKDTSSETKAAIKKLKELEIAETNANGNLLVKKIEKSHKKLLLFDNVYTVIGSFNWLSNKEATMADLSIKIDSKDLTSELKDRTLPKFK